MAAELTRYSPCRIRSAVSWLPSVFAPGSWPARTCHTPTAAKMMPTAMHLNRMTPSDSTMVDKVHLSMRTAQCRTHIHNRTLFICAHQEHFERCAEGPGHLVGDRHASAGQCEHQHVGPPGVVGQLLGEVATRLPAVVTRSSRHGPSVSRPATARR